MDENQQFEQLKKEISKYLDQSETEPIAAFDADGTLWDMDMSESFFQFQIDHQLVKDLPPDPVRYYKEMHDENPRKAYLWLAQINAGLPLATLQSHAKQFIEELKDPRLIAVQIKLIQYLQSQNIKIYIITASVKWAVEPGALTYYNIENDQVIGVSTQIQAGKITTTQDGPITWREGKVKGLLEKTNQKLPFFASGNTMGDLPLLESASHIKWVVAASKSNSHLWDTEQALLALAKQNNWHHRFQPEIIKPD